MQFTDLNETARLEWVDAEDLTFRFEYSNRFYGSCTFVARVVKYHTHWILDRSSLSTEKHAVKRGELPGLLKLATIFLKRLLLRSPSLEALGYSPQLAEQTAFPSEIADSVV